MCIVDFHTFFCVEESLCLVWMLLNRLFSSLENHNDNPSTRLEYPEIEKLMLYLFLYPFPFGLDAILFRYKLKWKWSFWSQAYCSLNEDTVVFFKLAMPPECKLTSWSVSIASGHTIEPLDTDFCTIAYTKFWADCYILLSCPNTGSWWCQRE